MNIMHYTHLLHVLRLLTFDYQHIRSLPALYRAYLHDHALAFLRSGITSGTGGKNYLHWLTWHRVTPVDW